MRGTLHRETSDRTTEYIKKLLAGDDALYQHKLKWARVPRTFRLRLCRAHPRHQDTKGKLQDAYGVVSPYRLYFIKDGLTGLGVRVCISNGATTQPAQVEKEIALLDMLEIGGYGTDNLTLRYRDKKDQPTLSISTHNASTLIQVLRTAYVPHSDRLADAQGPRVLFSLVTAHNAITRFIFCTRGLFRCRLIQSLNSNSNLHLRSYRQITVGMPEDLGLKVSVPTQNLVALQPLHVYASVRLS